MKEGEEKGGGEENWMENYIQCHIHYQVKGNTCNNYRRRIKLR